MIKIFTLATKGDAGRKTEAIPYALRSYDFRKMGAALDSCQKALKLLLALILHVHPVEYAPTIQDLNHHDWICSLPLKTCTYATSVIVPTIGSAY
jgi:hypothetical protein